jgi:L-threonylcarbamoyladenylate synthase
LNTIVSSDIEKASLVLKNGGVIIFPTETVYGIGADSRNLSACQKIYSIKNRPIDNPFIVHVDSYKSMEQIAVIPKKYRNSIEHLIPGPITFILEKKDESIFSSGLSTIGVRIPAHPVANAILRISKIPVSAPSANLSGRPSITRSRDAVNVFSGKVDFILTGDDSEIGIESTVVDMTNSSPVLLRPGLISFTELTKVFPSIKKYELGASDLHSKPASPGMKYRHYAPDCEVILLRKDAPIVQTDSTAFIGFTLRTDVDFYQTVNSNLEYMHHLYSFFIDCDERKIKKAYCQFPIQDEFEEVLLNRIDKAALK